MPGISKSVKAADILPGRKPKLIALLIGLVGFLLVLLSQTLRMSDRFARLFEHSGDALMVAAVLGYLLHVTEMADFFGELARQIMIERKFLSGLNQPRLRELRSEISRELVGKNVDNAPPHEWEAFHACTETLLFDKCLPAADATAGIYPCDYRDDLILHFMTLADAAPDLKLSMEGLGEPLKSLECVRYERITEFQVIAPRKREPCERPVPIVYTLPDFPGLDPRCRVSIWAGSCEADAKLIPITDSSSKDGRAEVRGSVSTTLVNGIGSVWKKTVAYLIGEWDPFTLMTMSMVTRGVDVRVSVTGGSGVKVRFDGKVWGLGKSPDPAYFSNGIRLSFPGWLLEDHGYFVHWWREPAGLSETRKTLTPQVVTAPQISPLPSPSPSGSPSPPSSAEPY